ncbi:MAG: N-carbamoylputrescine amidase [Sulfuricurvum sp.]|jgi:N-carbamoylputrescine amidase|uniref:N-carbamoylputrescine amidase n=1 Tax=Sulfuricurvum sp. TaxID=2025608 RepID=UPI0025FD11ED|nr:N-carbamoylputrescine amidase [Sulfuricurvum sp.]MCK9371692.1 N-carbamoylputrescine amidase [Sulfuricurvum sp.]
MVKIAAIQMQMDENRELNVTHAEAKVREAARNGAQIILLPELFEGHYFCKDMDRKYFAWAQEREGHPMIRRFSALAKELDVVLPISYFEKDGEHYFNSLVMIDADGTVMENYRKTHIPDGPGYEEKFYFEPGDSGFKVWQTRYANVGVGICWDQWFPETARSLTLMGADMIFYPTAIGSEPEIGVDSASHWQRVQMGHSAANIIPVIAANRIGEEVGESCTLTFYGSSFITDHTGAKVAEASRDKEEILYSEFDSASIREHRHYWGLIRDRRPEYYGKITETHSIS